MSIKDKSCGIILVLRNNDDEERFLILQQNHGHWSFPKGHGEKGETFYETAVRELKEETGITEIEFSGLPSIKDNYYVEKDGEKHNKTVECFIAFTKNNEVIIQESEVKNYKWATYREAMDVFTFDGIKKVLETAQNYLQNESRK